MKKILLLILILIAAIVVFFQKKEEVNTFIYADIFKNISENEVVVNRFTIYGKHLNIEGELPSVGDYQVVLKNNSSEIAFNTIVNDNIFTLSDVINQGINLETIDIGEYLILLKNTSTGEYYTIVNNTEYHDNSYYTITRDNKNNHITFSEESYNEQKYWLIKVLEEELPSDVYDIVIDPGHGGMDTGASNGKYHESKYTLEYAKALKLALEEEGLKVKLTRDTDVMLDHYGEGSRTGIPYEVKAKLMLSIHLNSSASSKQRGVEIYKAYNDDNTFARILADNIANYVGIPYSNNPVNRVETGIYMRVYSKKDIDNVIKDAVKGGYEPYDIDDSTTYYYFIRETGGIITKAFSDGRTKKYKANPYINYNQGVENYLCELAYISQKEDLSLVLNKKDNFVKALKESVLEYVNN